MAETVLTATAVRESAVSHEKRMPHIQALDGVRGLAITLVLLFHLLSSNNEPTHSWLIDMALKLRNAGWVGVDLFFVLSGFLITGILFDSLGDKKYFRNFYARRTLRIFPLYYAVLAVLFLLFLPAWESGRKLYLLLAYLQNTPLWWHAPTAKAIDDVTNHLWSLAAEEQFYLVWPVLVVLVRDRRKLIWIALSLALMAPIIRTVLLAHGATFEATYKMTICRCDSLLAGAWLALAIRGSRRQTILRMAGPFFCLSVFLCLVIAWRSGLFFWGNNLAINRYGYSLLAVAGTSLIALTLRPGSWTAAVMNISPLRWMGRYSYGIYIFHQMVGVVYISFLYQHIHSKMVLHAAIPICNLMLTLPLAWLSFRFYEQPFLRLKRYFGPA